MLCIFGWEIEEQAKIVMVTQKYKLYRDLDLGFLALTLSLSMVSFRKSQFRVRHPLPLFISPLLSKTTVYIRVKQGVYSIYIAQIYSSSLIPLELLWFCPMEGWGCSLLR